MKTYLVDVEHVGIRIPRVLVQARLCSIVDKVARTVFLEEADHGGACGTAVQPEDQRSIRWAVSCSEEPEPHVHVGSCSRVSLVSIDGSVSFLPTSRYPEY